MSTFFTSTSGFPVLPAFILNDAFMFQAGVPPSITGNHTAHPDLLSTYATMTSFPHDLLCPGRGRTDWALFSDRSSPAGLPPSSGGGEGSAQGPSDPPNGAPPRIRGIDFEVADALAWHDDNLARAAELYSAIAHWGTPLGTGMPDPSAFVARLASLPRGIPALILTEVSLMNPGILYLLHALDAIPEGAFGRGVEEMSSLERAISALPLDERERGSALTRSIAAAFSAGYHTLHGTNPPSARVAALSQQLQGKSVPLLTAIAAVVRYDFGSIADKLGIENPER